jgi:arylsulfatase A-like enzyme
VASLLAARGYETHLFGVQHVTRDVERLGFHGVHDRTLAASVAEDVTDLLCTAQANVPLYLEINLEQPHRPYDQGEATPVASEGISRPPWLPDDPATFEELAVLQGAIRAADEGVAGILDALERSGIAEDSFVVFTADHGLAMPRAKCTLYDPGIEIALLMRWPNRLLSPSVVDGLVSNIDVLPTVLEAVGAPMPDDISGRSLWPLIRGDQERGREEVYAEKTFHSYYDPMRGIRTGRFKLIRNFESSPPVEVPADVQAGAIFRSDVERYSGGDRADLEFYDLTSDPLEQRNVASAPEFAEPRKELDALLWRWMAVTADPLLQGPVLSPAYRRALASQPSD